MNKQSLFFTCLVAIVSTGLMLLALQFFAKKLKLKRNDDTQVNISYAIWFISICFSFFTFLKVALEQTENAIEVIIYSRTIEDTFLEVMQRIVIFTGFSFVFTFTSYFIVDGLFKITNGNNDDAIEIERNNYPHFIMKGIVLLMFVFSLISIFEHFLRWFAPSTSMPFFH